MRYDNHLIRRFGWAAALCLPVLFGLAMFDDSAGSTAAWAGMVIAATAGALGAAPRGCRR